MHKLLYTICKYNNICIFMLDAQQTSHSIEKNSSCDHTQSDHMDSDMGNRALITLIFLTLEVIICCASDQITCISEQSQKSANKTPIRG